MADYCTAKQVAAFAQEFGQLDDEEAKASLITAASRLFDNLADVEQNFFQKATGEAFKVFYGTGTAYLKVPPYVGTLGADPIVIVDDNDDEYADADLPEYFEKDGYLVIRGYGAGVPTRDTTNALLTQTFEGWPLNYEITVSANWGFEEVPHDVQMATVQLAIHLWRTSDPAFTAISQTGDAPLPAVPVQAKEVAERYRQKYTQKAYFA